MVASLNCTQALLTENVPSKEQAIILDSVDGVQIHEYAVALGSKIGPENIRYLSRIANNRVCIYLSTKEVADNLIENHKTVKVRDTDIYIRSLISRNKRLILSNVPPIIPNDVIIEKLKESEINPVSNISTLRAGLNIPGYQHILSFRRQVFIKPEEANNIPTLWKIDFDDTSYYVYSSLDTMLCFNCKEEGHLAKACPINPQSDADKTKMTTTSHSSQENTVTQKPTFPSLPSRTSTLIAPNNTTKPPADINNTSPSTKRPRSDGSSQSSVLTQEQLFAKPKTTEQLRLAKKVKPDSQILSLPTSIEVAMQSTPADFPYSYTQLSNFLEDAPKIKCIEELLAKHKFSAADTVVMLRKLYLHLENRKQKRRFTRIINRIEGNVIDDTSSQSSYGSSGNLMDLEESISDLASTNSQGSI
ncbi:Similar to Transposon TX1 uncharacterized 82 kDa protein (Xenopus laevis) [Cotesia congregata]|uniref:Similar to Transposon TX1 uncharacterized 82 kDa protein (Xenopus laevis) n=1 Tax=Cotesia congregata TaxID=51543 RepID=A0A8J2EK81_COTCN|nr:Similar to Transposon TX1 uncharacterized 82 kDa protein (Xenopus laevis) [Cotesia congregata]